VTKDWRGRAVAAAIGLALGGSAGVVFAAEGAPSVGAGDKAAIEAIVRNYILEHPEILPEAMKRLEARERGKQIDANRAAIETPFAKAWAGAADADVVLVEYFDYNCGYCRRSVAEVDRLLAEDKKLKVVFRELPILSAESDLAARASLVAAKHGNFIDFHRRLYAAGSPTEAKIAAVAKESGIDQAAIKAGATAADAQREIDGNIEMARTLGMSGTPTFIVGDQIFMGAVGYDVLKAAIAETRAAKAKG